DTPHHVDDEDVAALKAEPVPAGSILFAKIGEAISQNFRAIASVPMLIDNNTMAAIPDRHRVDQRYLFQYLRATDLYCLVSKTTVPALRKSDLQRLHIPLPFPDDPERSLAEQKRIAAILDNADAIRRKRLEASQIAGDLIPSLFRDIF